MTASLLIDAYHDYEVELFHFLAKRLGSHSVAADLKQDLYLKILRTKGVGKIRNHRSFLFKMAANMAIDHVRTESRRNELLSEATDVAWSQSDELSPDRYAIAKAELRFLEQVLQDLPDRSREAFFLYRFEGVNQTRIAELLGVGVTTVYKDLNLVLSALVSARKAFHGKKIPALGKDT